MVRALNLGRWRPGELSRRAAREAFSCETCGSSRHETQDCGVPRRTALGIPERSPFQIPRVLPPGWSYIHQERDPEREVVVGQVWASPAGMRYRVELIDGGRVSLRTITRGQSYAARAAVTTLQRRWYFLRDGADG